MSCLRMASELPVQQLHAASLARGMNKLMLPLLALLVAYGAIVVTPTELLSSYLQPQAAERSQRLSKQHFYERCERLASHEGGHWEHHYPSSLNGSEAAIQDLVLGHLLNASSVRERYFPVEIDWMAGNNWPANRLSAGCNIEYNPDGHGSLMYQSSLGNQCGKQSCLVQGFRPSLSHWVPANISYGSPSTGGPTSPTLNLVHRLAKANRTLCLAGDSIDYQFYDALLHNIFRQQLLQNRINVTVGERRDVPVNYTNETGVPLYTIYATMQSIKETTVTLADAADGGAAHSATIRYFQTYGWSPWNTMFMEDCNIIVYTLGLHYDARKDDMNGNHWYGPKYQDDFRAAVTFLVDFVASGRNRLAVWRLVVMCFFPMRFSLSASSCFLTQHLLLILLLG